jgi:hypothetical protein
MSTAPLSVSRPANQNALAVKCGAGTAICMTLHDADGLRNLHFLSFPAFSSSHEKSPFSLVFYL